VVAGPTVVVVGEVAMPALVTVILQDVTAFD
jgi:hypothetical protein